MGRMAPYLGLGLKPPPPVVMPPEPEDPIVIGEDHRVIIDDDPDPAVSWTICGLGAATATVKRNVAGESFDRANNRDVPLDDLLVRNPEYLLRQPVQLDGDGYLVTRADATSGTLELTRAGSTREAPTASVVAENRDQLLARVRYRRDSLSDDGMG